MSEAWIRPAAEGDARAIAEVGYASWDAVYRGLMPDELIEGFSVDRRMQGWLARLEEGDPERRTWVLEDGEGVQGYSSTGPTREDDGEHFVGEIYSIYLHPARWDRGWGRALLELAVDDLFAREFEVVRLWCLSNNPRARKFYEGNGFIVEEEDVPKEFDGVPLPHTRYVKLNVASG